MDVPADNTTPDAGDILIVDDTPANLRLLFDMLVEEGYRVRVAPNGELALRNARAAVPELILLDIAMPRLSGYEVCAQLKADQRLRAVPVLFLSAMDQPEDIVRAFAVGGVDFIGKPFQCREVLARVNTHLTLHRLQRQLASANQQLQDMNRQLQQEIETRKQAEAELQRLATTDSLTGILNRRQLYRVGQQELQRACRYGHPLSLIMLDIDRFKTINDRHGHAVGDRVIRQTVDTLHRNLRSMDLIGRYGGDEFIIILPETDLSRARDTAERLRAAVFQQGVESGGQHIATTLSMGVSGIGKLDPHDKLDFEFLIHAADQALYGAKQAGRNRVEVQWA